MPSPVLLQAIARLEEAVSRIEASAESLCKQAPEPGRPRDAAIREAIAELDSLIASVREKNGG